MDEPQLIDERDASLECEGRWFRVSETLVSAEGSPCGCRFWEFRDASLVDVQAWAARQGLAAYSIALVDEPLQYPGGPVDVRHTWLIHVGQSNAEPWDDIGGNWRDIRDPSAR